jgi:protein phosphatase
VTGFDQIEHASSTDVGIRRSHNQDSHAVLLAVDPEQWHKQGHIFLVADGMGAHAVGELASELAASIIPHTYHKYSGEGPSAALRKAFLEANTSIHSRGQQNRDFQGMGTTATVLLLQSDFAWIGHVGDSRTYRIRNGQIEQLTFDHSLVWEMARRQRVRPEGLKGIPTNVIIRSLGPDPLVQVDIEGPHPLFPGDVFLICSDGLSGQLTDYEIGALTSVLPPAEACQLLMQLANLRGGPDNITVVIASVRGAGPANGTVNPHLTSKKSWLRFLPWPLIALFVGVVLAAESAVLSASQHSVSKYTFVLAAVSILGGLAGLAVNYFREQRISTSFNPEPRQLKIYRQTQCRIEKPLVENLAKAVAGLHRFAKEKNWEVDWSAHQIHRDQAETAQNKGDLVTSFREFARSIRPFTEAILKYRLKEDEFPAVWERTPN